MLVTRGNPFLPSLRVQALQVGALNSDQNLHTGMSNLYTADMSLGTSCLRMNFRQPTPWLQGV